MTSGSLRPPPLRQWDTSLKVPGLFLLMTAAASIRSLRLAPLPVMVALGLYAISGLRAGRLLKTLRIPLALAAVMGLFTALFTGTDTLFVLGPAVFRREGFEMALVILARVTGVMTVGAVMVGTTPLAGLSSAMRRLRVPPLLADMGILTGRYIMVIGEDHRLMSTARKLRGYRPGLVPALRVAVPAAAALLVRGFKRSENVFNAMRMRGYGEVPLRPHRGCAGFTPGDMLLFLVVILVSTALLALELFSRAA